MSEDRFAEFDKEYEKCSHCRDGETTGVISCPYCRGAGCDRCNWTGESVGKVSCRYCNGTGYVKRR